MERGESYVDKGYISTEFTAWCGQRNFFEQTSAISKKEAESYFRLLRWKKTAKKGWVCPEHFKK